MTQFSPRPKLLGELKAADFPETTVTVVCQDGSTCRFRSAFYHKEEEWIAVYTEHSGYHMFHLSTISSIRGAVREDNDRFALAGL